MRGDMPTELTISPSLHMQSFCDIEYANIHPIVITLHAYYMWPPPSSVLYANS